MVSVVLYEDNDDLRKSISNMLSLNGDYRVKGSYSNVLTSEAEIRETKPDVILMDIDMPGMSGIEAVTKIRSYDSRIPILMLTVFDDNQHVFEAICAGASGYLLKKHISKKLFESITEVMSGGAPLSPSVARMVISAMQRKPTHNPYQLTPREKEILTSLSKGNSYKLIAAELLISIDTVRVHIKNIYEKLHVHSQTEAVSKALNERLV